MVKSKNDSPTQQSTYVPFLFSDLDRNNKRRLTPSSNEAWITFDQSHFHKYVQA